MSTELLKYLSKKIQEEQDVLIKDLGLGSAKDHGEYKYACGIIRGLMIANNIIIETSERMDNSDE